MNVQFREQTPGVRSGDWLDPATGRYQTIVTIQSLDGWVAYIGDKRIGADFTDHGEAAQFAIAHLKAQHLRQTQTRKFLSLTASIAAICALTFAIYGTGDAQSRAELVAKPAAQAQPSSARIQQAQTPAQEVTSSTKTTLSAPNNDNATNEDETSKKSATFLAAQSQRSPITSVQQKTTAPIALPLVNEEEAERAPWQRTSEPFNSNSKPLAKKKTAEEREFSRAATSRTTTTTRVSRAVINAPIGTNAASKERTTLHNEPANRSAGSADSNNAYDYADDLAADMRADKADFARRESRDKSTYAYYNEGDPGLAKTRTTPQKPSTRSSTIKRSRWKNRQNPLVKKVIKKNIFGQRYVVYQARKPRNNREYKKLKRLKQRLSAEQQNDLYRYFGGY